MKRMVFFVVGLTALVVGTAGVAGAAMPEAARGECVTIGNLPIVNYVRVCPPLVPS